jgi:hypothetical protein
MPGRVIVWLAGIGCPVVLVTAVPGAGAPPKYTVADVLALVIKVVTSPGGMTASNVAAVLGTAAWLEWITTVHSLRRVTWAAPCQCEPSGNYAVLRRSGHHSGYQGAGHLQM